MSPEIETSSPSWDGRKTGVDRTHSVSPGGSDRFLNAMAVLNKHLGYRNADLRGTLDPGIEKLLDIVFVQRTRESGGTTLEDLKRCPLEVPSERLQLPLAAPIFGVADLIPRGTLSSVLDAMADGNFLQDDREAWRAVRYIRRALKLTVNAIRIFDEDNSAAELSSVNRKLGRIIDIVTYDGDREEAKRQADKARKKWRTIEEKDFLSLVHSGNQATVHAYLDRQFCRISHTAWAREIQLPLEDIHDCRKGLQTFMNLHRLLWIQDGAKETEILPFRVLAGISRQLGAIHNLYVEQDVRGTLKYGDATASLPYDLKEALQIICGEMRFA